MLKGEGRTIKWVAEQFGLSYIQFWRRMRDDSFSEEDKERIRNIITNG